MSYINDCGYVIVRRNGKKYFEHRLVWQEVNGQIPNGYVIHHKNGIKTDNRIDNLEMVENNGKHKLIYHPGRIPEGERLKPFTEADFDFTMDRLPSLEQIARIKEITKH